MILYHFNFGWPLVDEGTDILWQGAWHSMEGDKPDKIFSEGSNFKKCPAPLTNHNGIGEAVAAIDASQDRSGKCTCGLYNSKLGLAVAISFQKKQLPWLTNWQHWGKDEYVTGLEPGTNPPIGQAKARKENQLILLAPGASRSYDLEIQVLEGEAAINTLLKNTSLPT
jgi:hypothetical protein